MAWSRTAQFCSWEVCKECDSDIAKTYSAVAFALSDSWSFLRSVLCEISCFWNFSHFTVVFTTANWWWSRPYAGIC